MKLLISFLLGVVIGLMLFCLFNHYYNHKDDKIIFNNTKYNKNMDTLKTLDNRQKIIEDEKNRIKIVKYEALNNRYKDLKKEYKIDTVIKYHIDTLYSEIEKRDSIISLDSTEIKILIDKEKVYKSNDTIQNEAIDDRYKIIQKQQKNIKRKNLALKIITPIAVVSLILLLL